MTSRTLFAGKVLGASVISAILASWCCILPLLALLTGGGVSVSNAKWIEPLRPYIMGISIAALAIAWIQFFRRKSTIQDCCQQTSKPMFFKSRSFLILMTFFVLTSLTLPLYSNVLFGKKQDQYIQHGNIQKDNIQKIELEISGMTCTGCENHIEHAISELPGIMEVNASYKNGITTILYDSLQVGLEQFDKVIQSNDYQITHSKHPK